jgi:threonine synthase
MSKLVCHNCDSEFYIDDLIWKCTCGGPLDIEHSPEFHKPTIQARRPTLWRYREAIPIQDNNKIVSFDEGFSPMLELDFLGKKVLVKQEQLFQTGSYKDRGATVLISKANELGVTRVVEDSSGNAGCAIAAYAAAVGIGCDIYVPLGTSLNKLVQLEFYGANVVKVLGNREATAAAVQLAAEKCYYASHYWNPFFFHGTKTFAFEICEQLGWSAPDRIVLPVGNGTLILGAFIGFSELKEAGIIGEIPKIIAVQAANCAPLANAFLDGLDKVPENPSVEFEKTIADGIEIAEPARGNQILKAVRDANGDFVTVSEQEIGTALLEVGKRGFYIEPTSAATIAGLKKYIESGSNYGDETLVTVFTGHGLKSTENMLKVLNEVQ